MGHLLTTGVGSLNAGVHFAKFIDELLDAAAGFTFRANFPTATTFGSLDISSTQPVSVLALRLTTNQRGEMLLTSTPIADLSAAVPTTTPLYFPQLADGGGYTTTLSLLNTSGATESGTFAVFDDNGAPCGPRESGGTSAARRFHIPFRPTAVSSFKLTDPVPRQESAG